MSWPRRRACRICSSRAAATEGSFFLSHRISPISTKKVSGAEKRSAVSISASAGRSTVSCQSIRFPGGTGCQVS